MSNKTRKSLHEWEKFYEIKILFMHPGQKNRKFSHDEFKAFIKNKTIQLTVDCYSLDKKYRSEVI